MRLLCDGLTAAGLDIVARSPARHDWANDPAFLAALSTADVIVINGEGTLHHGKPAGETLLKIVDHPNRKNTPVALVNALYQDNPAHWNAWLEKCDLLSARDSKSAEALTLASGKPARWLPDLSLSALAPPSNAPRSGVIVGDSVKFPVRKALAQAATQIPMARFVPTKTLRGRIWNWSLARGMLYRLYNGVFAGRRPPFVMPANEAAYLAELATADLHLTGRFHAVCLSMLTETPFLAVTSNASKIERLLIDAGLGTSRMRTLAQLKPPPASAPFTTDELIAIAEFRQRTRDASKQLFSDIAALAKGASS